MSMDAMQQVAESEQKAKERLAQAKIEAQALIAQAQRDGEAALAQARQAAQQEVKNAMAKAEAEGEARRQAVLEKYGKEAQALRDKAEQRLDRAADLIVGKVVRD